MKISPVGKSTSPAISRTQTQQTQQARQTQPQSRSQPAALPLPTRNQNQQTTPQGLTRSKSLPTYLPAMSRSQTKDTTTLVPDKDKSTIKYATQAALNGNPLTAADLSRVRQVNHGMYETRESIKVRGNVSSDIRQTDGANITKVEIGQAYARRDNRDTDVAGQALYDAALDEKSKKELFATPEFKRIIETANTNRAAYAAIAEAGNCSEMAYTTTRNLAGKELPRDTIETMKSTIAGVDHAFTTVTPQENSGNSKIIADAWMSGPAHREEDGLSMHKGSKQAMETYSSTEDKAVLHQRYKAKIDNAKLDENYHRNYKTGQGMKDIIQNTIAEISQEFPSKPGLDSDGKFNGVYNEAQSLSPKFRDDARASALRAVQLEGPPQKGKALVVPEPEYTTQFNNDGNTVRVPVQRDRVPERHVNDMIPLVANELGIPRNDRYTFDSLAIDDLATHVGGVVRREAMKSESAPFREEHDKWVNKK